MRFLRRLAKRVGLGRLLALALLAGLAALAPDLVARARKVRTCTCVVWCGVVWCVVCGGVAWGGVAWGVGCSAVCGARRCVGHGCVVGRWW